MMKKSFKLILSVCLVGLFIPFSVDAESWLSEGAREFEELRMRQLETVQSEGDINPFSTDGCSGFQSQQWELFAKTLPGFEKQLGDKPPWENCCVAHDKAYWRGEVVNGYARRKNADQELKQCIIATGTDMAPQLAVKYSVSEEKVRQAFSVTAELMYRAVRIGGLPCSLLPWRWGYGWAHCALAKVNEIPDQYSNVKLDENLIFFNTAAWLDPDNACWNIPIHAWIYEPEDSAVRSRIFATLLASHYDLHVNPQTQQNFYQRINLLIADNERGKKIVIRIAGKDITLPDSEANGHIYQILRLPIEVVNASSPQKRLHYFAVMSPDDGRRFEGEVQLVPHDGNSIISDIDDTIKLTEVTNHRQLFNNTFYKDFRQVPGMPELYQSLGSNGATIHFVSSSPWQLYTPLQEFIHRANFPWASMSLKYVRFRDETFLNLFKKGTETKPEQIEPILQRYPDRQFILIGDNGEQDPEVYGDIARRYPAQIRRILIRNVDNSRAEDERYQLAFKDISKNKWQLFKQTEEIPTDML